VSDRPLKLELIKFESVSVDERGLIVECRKHSAQQVVEDLGKGVSLELIAIPAGTFWMGSPHGQGCDDERPIHSVRVASFFMSRQLITQAQWLAVMDKLPPCRFIDPQRPVENVAWAEARTFCERLSKRGGRAYRLPSEAQWEYACRAESRTPFCCGRTITTELANYNGEFTFLSEPKGIYRHHTTVAGTFPPNAFGLYDMHGNLWEWCADVWHDDYAGAPTDGRVWESQEKSAYRVARGGSWHDTPDVCRSAVRLKCEARAGDEMTGFRVVMGNT
jgi:formylglycine-generating enzyme required for sulfatase activity